MRTNDSHDARFEPTHASARKVFEMPRQYPYLRFVDTGYAQQLVAQPFVETSRFDLQRTASLGGPNERGSDQTASHVEARLEVFRSRADLQQGPPNELLDIGSSYRNAAGNDVPQRWTIRRRDALLLSLSRAYAARQTPVHPPHKLALAVLVSGFAPFGGATLNASTEAAKLVNEAGIRAALSIPPWLELELELDVITDVDVVWSCGAQRLQADANPPRLDVTPLRGGQAIVQRAKQMRNGQGADLVLLVGEQGGLSQVGDLIRLDHFARNRGANTSRYTDNDGNRLRSPESELLVGAPEYLEASIPRLAWAYTAHTLLERAVRLCRPSVELSRSPSGGLQLQHDSAGAFVCNESYYQLLAEAYLGEGGDRASRRWVQLAHVDAARSDFEAIASALTYTVAALLQYMLWAPEGFGYVGTCEDEILLGRGGVVCS